MSPVAWSDDDENVCYSPIVNSACLCPQRGRRPGSSSSSREKKWQSASPSRWRFHGSHRDIRVFRSKRERQNTLDWMLHQVPHGESPTSTKSSQGSRPSRTPTPSSFWCCLTTPLQYHGISMHPGHSRRHEGAAVFCHWHERLTCILYILKKHLKAITHTGFPWNLDM